MNTYKKCPEKEGMLDVGITITVRQRFRVPAVILTGLFFCLVLACATNSAFAETAITSGSEGTTHSWFDFSTDTWQDDSPEGFRPLDGVIVHNGVTMIVSGGDANGHDLLTVEGTGSNIRLLDGSLTSGSEEYFNDGSFYQLGGIHTILNTLTIGDIETAGNYFLEGGTLNAQSIIINSNFLQSGGSINSDVTIGPDGILTFRSGSLTGSVLNDGHVVFEPTQSTTFNTPISGAGDVTKNGSGTLVLNGINAYTGGTTINAGNLQVGDGKHLDARIFGPVTVNPDGTLSGHGAIIGDVSNSGTLSPGGSIGTLTVVGNVTFNPGSTFNVEINPNRASLLSPTGSATLGNADVRVLANPGTYQPRTYTILDAGGGISGRFAGVTIINPSVSPSLELLTPSLQYLPNRVNLSLDVVADPVGPLNMVTDTWLKTTLRTVGGRLNAPLGEKCPENSLGFWARGLGMLSSSDTNGRASGYDAGTAGTVLGFDRQFGEYLTLGIAGFTAHTDVTTFQSFNNQSSSDSAGASLYAAFTPGAWQFKAVLGYDNDTYRAQRRATDGAVTRQASSKTENNHVNGYSEISYSFKSADLTLQPLVGLQLGWMHQNGFSETGGIPGQNLTVNGRTRYTLDTLVGLRTRKELDVNKNLKAQFEVRALYQHDFGTRQNSLSGQFSNGQAGLLATADRPDEHDAGILGASLSLLTADSLNFYLDYNGEFRSGQQAHFIAAGIRYSW